MAHGETEQGATIASAVLPAIRGLDDDRARLYYDLVYNSLNEAARRALEAMMKGYEYQSDFAKKYVAQGRAEGRTEGRAEEAARALLTVLRARDLDLELGLETGHCRVVAPGDLDYAKAFADAITNPTFTTATAAAATAPITPTPVRASRVTWVLGALSAVSIAVALWGWLGPREAKTVLRPERSNARTW